MVMLSRLRCVLFLTLWPHLTPPATSSRPLVPGGGGDPLAVGYGGSAAPRDQIHQTQDAILTGVGLSAIYSSLGATPYARFLEEVVGDTHVAVGEWVEVASPTDAPLASEVVGASFGSSTHRLAAHQRARSVAWRNVVSHHKSGSTRYVAVTERVQCLQLLEDGSLILDEQNKISGVPFSEHFTVFNRLVFSDSQGEGEASSRGDGLPVASGVGPGCRFRAWVHVAFERKLMVGRTIRSSTWSETGETHGQLAAFVTTHQRRLRDEPPAAADAPDVTAKENDEGGVGVGVGGEVEGQLTGWVSGGRSTGRGSGATVKRMGPAPRVFRAFRSVVGACVGKPLAVLGAPAVFAIKGTTNYVRSHWLVSTLVAAWFYIPLDLDPVSQRINGLEVALPWDFDFGPMPELMTSIPALPGWVPWLGFMRGSNNESGSVSTPPDAADSGWARGGGGENGGV